MQYLHVASVDAARHGWGSWLCDSSRGLTPPDAHTAAPTSYCSAHDVVRSQSQSRTLVCLSANAYYIYNIKYIEYSKVISYIAICIRTRDRDSLFPRGASRPAVLLLGPALASAPATCPRAPPPAGGAGRRAPRAPGRAHRAGVPAAPRPPRLPRAAHPRRARISKRSSVL